MKAAIFDADGTILDSLRVWDNIADIYLNSINIYPKEDLNLIFKNYSFNTSAQYLIDNYNLNISVEELINEFNKLVSYKYNNTILAKPNIVNVLNKLASENIVCCILTASDSELIYNSLNRLGLAKYFKFIYSCIGSNYDKNSIDIYNIILDKLNVKEEECYIFEDALYALNTIKDTKFKVYAIYDEYNKDDWTNINNLDINTLNEWSEFYE